MAKRATAVARSDAPQPIFKLLGGELTASANTRVVDAICSTAAQDRMGDSVVQSGIDFAGYMKTNPTALWAHNHNMPVARCVEMGLTGGNLRARFAFPADGEDADADWVYGKIKAGLVNTVSIGFMPKEYEPLNPKEPWGGYRFQKSELLEVSFCAVPANAQAVIVGRSILAAGAPEMPPSRTQAAVAKLTASVNDLAARTGLLPKLTAKGLYEVSWLAGLLESLGYLEDMVEWEAEQEGDNSPVPAMLLAALQQLGAALVAMTAEEVAELLGEEIEPATDDGSVIGSPMMAAYRAHQAAIIKAGRVLSAKNESDIKSAVDLLTNVLAQVEASDETKALVASLAIIPAGSLVITRERLRTLEDIAAARRRQIAKQARHRQVALMKFRGVM